ncbi:branched-chain amino acid ABC transporter permease [Natronospirillum operosum]|uniref:Branched-chain amino acid ABC transporter permease n=1 Tax=Natronospirillum operosum TaxID=2759953 RepID=A0A4Z0W7K6_9GAMM|nr:branched-chain amino acid ABC transporter permease [Natronospirillum operosum]TGG93367.1 branched-chain amino acid ABC transporter permease [Natronospirillum operosum]
MTVALIVEQILNGLQLGTMLFLMASGLTLVFGVMGLINLAHGSFYMAGAFVTATVTATTGNFWLGLLVGVLAAAAIGVIVEFVIMRRLYDRGHLDQVLATFALILIFSEGTYMIFGSSPLFLSVPQELRGSVSLPFDISYSRYRLAIIGMGVLVAIGLYLLISKTRLGMRIRAGENDREMIGALGVDIKTLYTLVFALGAGLAGLAGSTIGALQSVRVGMGEPVLIMAFVVIVIGGIGSIKGALVGALLVGLVDTLGRIFMPLTLVSFMPASQAMSIGSAVSSMLIYIMMATILAFRPHGLFGSK